MKGTVSPHLPRLAPIESYGGGGFRFAGMSHRGSLLCLPSGIWTWPPAAPAEITAASFAQVFAEAVDIGHFLIGAGNTRWAMPMALMRLFSEHRIVVETMRTGDAANTFNILLGEGRRVGAALIAVE